MTTIGAVGYLNALPLISGLHDHDHISVVTEVPASLFAGLESRDFDIALCPVIDAQRSELPLEIVGSGAIGSNGRTMTVRVFSRRPVSEIERIHVDRDSHTSIALLQVVFKRLHHRIPELLPLTGLASVVDDPDLEAVLLIGDKVVTDEPPRSRFPHQLDLGLAWKELTGLPFVFATWLTRAGTDLGTLPTTLTRLCEVNLQSLEAQVPGWAAKHGWPPELALIYLRDLLSYRFGNEEHRAVRLFWDECAALELIPAAKEIPMYGRR